MSRWANASICTASFFLVSAAIQHFARSSYLGGPGCSSPLKTIFSIGVSEELASVAASTEIGSTAPSGEDGDVLSVGVEETESAGLAG